MKNYYNYLLGILAVLFFATACEKEEFYNIEAVAPSDIRVTYQIATDDSGLLTVYPEATGASYFDIYFGDNGSSSPERVQAGEKTSHVYAEGDYTIRVVAYGLTGLTAEKEENVMIRFTAPENLMVNISFDPINSKKVTVTPSADNATLFEIFWGDVPDEEPETVLAGGSGVHTYADLGEYEIRVVAKSASITTLTYTETITILKNYEALRLPVNFDNEQFNYVFTDFGNVATSVVDNPDQTGINTSGKVAQSFKPAGAETWGGSFLQLLDPIDFSENQVFQVKVWAPESGLTVKMKLENATDGNIAQEVDVINTVANGWENLVFDFSGKDLSAELHKVVLFFDFGNNGTDKTFYYDDIFLGQDVLGLPVDFESTSLNYDYVNFGNAFSTIVANPDPSGANTSKVVTKTVKAAGAESWAGSFLELPDAIDFSAGNKIRLQVWSPKTDAVVKMKLENKFDPNISTEIDVLTTKSGEWENLTYDFSAQNLSNEYHRVVVFFDFGNSGDGAEYYFDNIRIIDDNVQEVLGLPLSFESSNLEYAFVNFGNAYSGVAPNPDKSGVNTSNNVVAMEKVAGAETWAGSFLELPDPIDFSKGNIIQIKTWSPKAGATVRLKLENAADGNIFVEKDAVTTSANAWETLTWDLSGFDLSADLHKVVIFFDFGVNGDGSVYYYDDIEQVDMVVVDEVLELPMDFESDQLEYVFTNFGNAFSGVIDNPDASGINTSSKVVQYEKVAGAETWAGSFIQLPNAIDFSEGQVIQIKTWSPKVGAAVRLKLENANDGNIFVEKDAFTTVANSWETLSWNLTGFNLDAEFHTIVIFFDFGVNGDGSKYYFDDIAQVKEQVTMNELALPINFESDQLEYAFTNFGNAFSGVIDNPDKSGINGSAKVAQYEKVAGAETWAGSFLQMPNAIDFAKGKKIKVKVWSPKAGVTVLLKLENETDGNIFLEKTATTATSNAWETLEFDFGDQDTAKSLHKVVLFFDFGVNGDGSLYFFDDIEQSN